MHRAVPLLCERVKATLRFLFERERYKRGFPQVPLVVYFPQISFLSLRNAHEVGGKEGNSKEGMFHNVTQLFKKQILLSILSERLAVTLISFTTINHIVVTVNESKLQ